MQQLIVSFTNFLNTSVIPLLFALAFLFFIFNAVRFFVIGGATDEGREKARRLMLWGIIGLVIMVSIWGIVNLLVIGLFGFGSGFIVCPDFVPNCGGQFGP